MPATSPEALEPRDVRRRQGSGFAECAALHAKILKAVQLNSLNQMFETVF
ncbi:hypothetical protein GCM10022223_13900 [Kineosporia mesophila]|uniref:Uncharacterized protein n=1 Tax=Kineosporia mesophila TaxID=566012 RepID=A0ABP6Z6S2_9ACTN|nr:hypothetical protein [Kineosporia mesophila]MCD5354801.1 hypothetical protein [Kineosporia mesophila]